MCPLTTRSLASAGHTGKPLSRCVRSVLSEGEAMLGPGLACSFAPAMFRAAPEWKSIHAWLTGDAPQPPQLLEETPDVIDSHARRIGQAFDSLRHELTVFRPDALVILASDNGRLFTDVQIPQLATFLG